MEPLARTWLIMASLPRSWLAFARSCMAMASLPRSWQDLGNATKELAMDLGKDAMASNTGYTGGLPWVSVRVHIYALLNHYIIIM